jgi:hypothetical protein
VKQKAKAFMPLILTQALLHSIPFGGFGTGRFHLPEIPPDERILYHGQKIRKHNTKRRGNKLHDKRR